MAGESGVQGFVWQIKDRSESGCRLRGRIVNSNRVLPGALVAFREHHNAPWTLAVVRRLRKRIGDRIDIGVEYIGRNPLVVTLAADVDRAADSTVASDRKRKHYAALHLHESSGHPHLPFRTLILSAREFNAGRCLSLRSDGAEYTVRLKEPIEEQDGFVWLSYEAGVPAGDRSVRPKVDRTAASWRLRVGRTALRSPPVLPQPPDRRCRGAPPRWRRRKT